MQSTCGNALTGGATGRGWRRDLLEDAERLRGVATGGGPGLDGAGDVVHRRRHVAELDDARREGAVELEEAEDAAAHELHPGDVLQPLREPPAGLDGDPRVVGLCAMRGTLGLWEGGREGGGGAATEPLLAAWVVPRSQAPVLAGGDALEGGRYTPRFQPAPSHRLPDAKCQLQWRL